MNRSIVERLPHGPEAIFIGDVIEQDEDTVVLSARFDESMERLGIENAPAMTSWFVEVMAQATIYLLPTEKPATGVLAKIDTLECHDVFDPRSVLVFRLHRLTNNEGALQVFEGTVSREGDKAPALATVRFSVFWTSRGS